MMHTGGFSTLAFASFLSYNLLSVRKFHTNARNRCAHRSSRKSCDLQIDRITTLIPYRKKILLLVHRRFYGDMYRMKATAIVARWIQRTPRPESREESKPETDGGLMTNLFHCAKCQRTFIDERLVSCPGCNTAVERTPSERELGLN